MAGRMEQTAAHAGMQGAYPYSTVAGTPRYSAAQAVQRPPGVGQYPGSGQQTEEDDAAPERPIGPSQFPDEPGAPSGVEGSST
jgi:hypothetical protein